MKHHPTPFSAPKTPEFNPFRLDQLPCAQLLKRLEQLVAQSNAITARLLAHLAEVEARNLYLQAACSSMFTYCVQVLGLSESATYKRLQVARLARRTPVIFECIQRGQLHLSGLCVLAPHLSEDNCAELLQQASGRSKRQIEQLVAERFAAADVPAAIRALPRQREKRAESTEADATLSLCLGATGGSAGARPSAEPLVASAAGAVPSDGDGGHLASARQAERNERARSSGPQGAAGCKQRTQEASRQIAPLAPRRYKVQLTAGESLHQKLREAQQPESHSHKPSHRQLLLSAVLAASLDLEILLRIPAVSLLARTPDRSIWLGPGL